MNRICVLGDSHTAALKLGWALIQHEHPAVQIDFFAAPGQFMADLEMGDGKLVPGTPGLKTHLQKTSGTASDIEPNYNGYVLCAMHCTIRRAQSLWNSFRSESQAKDNRAPVSDGCYAASMTGVMATTIAFRALEKLRQLTGAPAAVVPTPMLGEQRRASGWERMHQNGDDAIVAGFFNASCAHLAERIRARFLPQPDETLASPLHTRKTYGENPARFWVEGPDDGTHMNAHYGAVVLRLALKELAA